MRILCYVLSLSMMLSLLNVPVFASVKTMTGVGSYAVKLSTDPDTRDVPEEFGTTAADGRVWTDKSVTAEGDVFDVTLSALTQEYIAEGSSSGPSNGKAADVMLVLDITSSMYRELTSDKDSDKNNRIMALVDAANAAINTILEANPNNRVSVTVFGSDALSEEYMRWLPLDSYSLDTGYTYNASGTLSNGANDASYAGLGKYLVYSTSSADRGTNKFAITASAGLLDGKGKASSYKGSARTYSKTGTYTQYGIYTGMQWLQSQISAASYDMYREPYVLILTDGAATSSSTSWYGNISTFKGASGDSNYAAYTLLTAAYQKQQLISKYTNYNHSATDVTVFTIGIGSEITDAFLQMLDPSTITSTSTLKSNALNTIIGSTYTAYRTDSTEKYYIYPTPREGKAGYYTYTATDRSTLNTAFTDLGKLVETNTKTVTSPIAASGNIVLTDVLGEGMTLKSAPSIGSTEGTLSGICYTWNDLDTTVTYDENSRTLTWTIPSDELPTIMFTGRKNPISGSYSNADAKPIRLTYKVGLDDTSNLSGTYYCNAYDSNGAMATAVFTPSIDNTYYYTVSGDESTAKAVPSVVAKVTNVTDTAVNVASYSFDGGIITIELGNNGSMKVLAKIAKFVSSEAIASGGTLSYTIEVTNSTSSELEDVVVTDEVPSGMTSVSDISDGGSISDSKITWSINSIAALDSESVTYNARVPDTASVATKYTSHSSISRIDGNSLSTVAISNDVTSIVTPTITFNSNEGSAVSPITYTAGTSVDEPSEPTRDGYEFAGWYTEETLTSEATWPYVMPNENTTLYAKWTPEPTATLTPEPTVTQTPEPTVTQTPEPTVTQTPEPTVTQTPEPTVILTPTPTATPMPTETPMPTAAPIPVAAPTPTVTPTPTVVWIDTSKSAARGMVIDNKTGEELQQIPAIVTTNDDSTKTVEIKVDDAILLKQPDGSLTPFKDLSNLFLATETNNVTISSNGEIQINDLVAGTDQNITVSIDFGEGRVITIGTIEVKVDHDGNVTIISHLIDPYGQLTDSSTGEIIADADITLYYANTERNIEGGLTPDTVVELPTIDGFEPNDNANPQISDVNGTYGFMVYPNTDYYIVVEKDGYDKYTSPTIPVNDEIVKFDIVMNKTAVKKIPKVTDAASKTGEASEQQNTDTTQRLPQSGSFFDFTVLMSIGILLILFGTVYGFRKKHKNI